MIKILLGALTVCLCPVLAAPVMMDTTPMTPPSILQVFTPAVPVDGERYAFEIAFSTQKGPRGAIVLRAAVTVVKTTEAVTARWRDIVVVVSPDATQFIVGVDGRRFVLEAKYTEVPTVEGALPREVVTSFGQMFTGGKIGITAMLGS